MSQNASNLSELTKLPEVLQVAVGARVEKVRARLDETIEKLEHNKSLAFGQLRDAYLERAYGMGEFALGATGDLLERAQENSPLPLTSLQAPTTRLLKCARAMAKSKDDVQKPAIASYDELNVAKIKVELAKLDIYNLNKAKVYESAHKNRVTVLREIERLLG